MTPMRWSVVCLGIAFLGGCAPEPAAEPKPAEKPKPAAEPGASGAPSSDDKTSQAENAKESRIVVTPIDAEGLQAAVDKHAGKLVLVDCWATWCVPCVKAFPHTVALSKKHAGDLAVLSLSFDDPVDGQAPEKVKKFLEEKHAPFPHYISSLDLSNDGATAFDIPDGSLPHFKLYGRDGKLIRSFSIEEDADAPDLHESVAAAIEEALTSR